jgi:hypothetical protein
MPTTLLVSNMGDKGQWMARVGCVDGMDGCGYDTASLGAGAGVHKMLGFPLPVTERRHCEFMCS